MKIKKTITLMLLFVFNLAFISMFYGLDLRHRAFKTFRSNALTFDSRSQPGLSSIQEFTEKEFAEALNSKLKDIDITLRVKVYSIGEFNNIFQTSDVNQGIRLEISKPSTLGLVIGAEKVTGVVLTNSLELNKWYAISIKIDKFGKLEVLLDNIKAASFFLDSTDFRLDNVVIGTGFSKTRPFDGKIENFHIQSKSYKKQRRGILNTFYLIILIGLFTFLVNFVLAIKEIFPHLVKFVMVIRETFPLHRTTNTITAKKISIVNLILVAGTVSAIIFHYSRFAFIGDHGPKFSSFLHFPINIFADFYSIFDVYARFGISGGMNYFPGAYIPLGLLKYLTPNPYYAIQIHILLYVTLLAAYLYMSLREVDIINRVLTTFVLLACSYPVLFTLHTGNFEGICFLLVAFAIWLRIRGLYILAATLIGFAASIKLLPAIFLFAILNKSNKKKAILPFAISFAVLTLLPFVVSGSFPANMAKWVQASKVGMDSYYSMMVLSYIGQFFGHSLLNAIRILTGPAFDVSRAMPYYYIFGLISIGFIIYAIFRSPYLYSKVLMCACAISIFPPTSTDYKLQYLLIPLMLLLKSKREKHIELWMLVLIALTQIPKGYIFFYSSIYANINTVLNALLLIVLLLMAVYGGMRKRFLLPIRIDKAKALA